MSHLNDAETEKPASISYHSYLIKSLKNPFDLLAYINEIPDDDPCLALRMIENVIETLCWNRGN